MLSNLSGDKQIKVLQILPTLDVESGVSSFTVNHQKELLQYRIVFDYIYHFSKGNNYIDEVMKMGSSVYKLPMFTVSNYLSIQKMAKELFRKRDFDIVHSGQPNASFLYAPLAARKGTPFIQHSHSAGATSDSLIKDVRNRILMATSNRYITDRFACSAAAGRSLYGGKDFFVARNGVDGRKFEFSLEKRSAAREKLALGEDFTLACVGRMADQKNQEYLVKVMLGVIKECDRVALLMIGSGEKEERIKALFKENCLDKWVRFLGSKNDLNELYSAIDLLLMPSLYEGLPVAAIEAQFSGLNVLFSDKITQEASVRDGNKFLSLDNPNIWIKEILKRIKQPLVASRKEIPYSTYCMDISITSSKLAEKYYEIASRGIEQ